jgi:branched-chain amino acid transport system substrate-binding protein
MTKNPSTRGAGVFRRVAASAAAAALLCAASVAHVQAADTDPVKIGLVYAKQGLSARLGQFFEQGTEIAVDQAGNKVLGRPIQLIWLDEPSPQVGQQNMQKLIDDNKVVAVMGGTLSSTALAMAALAKRKQIPFIATNGAAAELTGKQCNRYTFRVQPTAAVHVRALLPYLSQLGKKWYTITPSYAFGQDVLRETLALSKSLGATVLGSDEVAVNTADYSSYIIKIREAQPTVVITSLVGMDLSNFLKQWHELGMNNKIPVAGIATSDSDFWDIGAAASTGIYVKPWYYNDPANPPIDKTFVAAFEKKFGYPPSEKAWLGWFSTRSLLQSIDTAKSTDPKAIVTSLEKWKTDENGIPVHYRDWDHQLIRPAIILKVKPKITDKFDFFDVVEHSPKAEPALSKAYGTPEEIGCHMDPL